MTDLNETTNDETRDADSGRDHCLIMPEYGARITANEVLERHWENRMRGNHSCGWKLLKRTPKTIKGIYLGTRSLHNGWSEFIEDEGQIFIGVEHFTAALVSPGPNLNPVYVPLDAVKA